jgi:MSHA biogenesis protein MshP
MRPENSLPAKVRGFGLVAAMFVMIVMSMVVIAMSRLSITQHGSNSLAIQQARAYQAARAGLEWGIAQALMGNCARNSSVSMAGSNLSEFTVTVDCPHPDPLANPTPGPAVYSDNGAVVNIYRLTATAQNGSPGGRSDYAYRQLIATVER